MGDETNKPRPGALTECGTWRWCSLCGLVLVARNHAETRCWECERAQAGPTTR